MWKNTMAIAALTLSSAVFIHSITPASARTGVVSFGSNPVFSESGFTTSTTLTLPAVSGQERIVTDIFLAAQPNYELEIILTTSGGKEIGRYKTWNYNSYSDGGLDTHLKTGLRVPEGEELNVSVNGRGVYTFSGFLAHP